MQQVGQKFIEDLRDYANALGEGVVIDVGLAAIENIRAKTLAGEYGGGRANVYNKDYAKRKKGGSMSPVTLRDTGRMMDSLRVATGSGTTVESNLRGGQIRGPYRGQTQALRDVSVNVIAEDPKAQYYVPMDQVGRMPFRVDELFVQEAIDLSLRRTARMPGGTERITINVL